MACNRHYQGHDDRVKMKIELNQKLSFLKQIYSIYDDFTATLDTACEKYCSRCCTNNVVMTALEGYFIAQNILENASSDLFERVKTRASKTRFLPQTTTNKIAELCSKGKKLPQENQTHIADACPLLTDDACPIYTARPFGCRCLISKHDCRQQGYADIEPFVLTANHLFLQFIEHVDAFGFSGNLTDVLIFMAIRENRLTYEANRSENWEAPLVSNLPIGVLMIPPEHRVQIQPILNDLRRLKKPNRTSKMKES